MTVGFLKKGLRMKPSVLQKRNYGKLERRFKAFYVSPICKNRERGRAWQNKRKLAWQRAGGRCYVCGALCEFSSDEFGFELDHITPLFKGGSNSLENLGVACVECHAKKTAEENKEVHGKK